eukprot:5109310-Pyramimonas_sp.AAC.1
MPCPKVVRQLSPETLAWLARCKLSHGTAETWTFARLFTKTNHRSHAAQAGPHQSRRRRRRRRGGGPTNSR